jgi:purine-binding chemotaxis protein CheW
MEVIEFEVCNNSTKERYAFDIKYINEVFKNKKITNLPCSAAFVIGIINYRGKILSVVDIRSFLGFANTRKKANEIKEVIIVRAEDLEFGIAADGIVGYYIIEHDEIQQNVLTITDEKKEFFIGVSRKGTIVLNIKNIILSEKIIVDDTVF